MDQLATVGIDLAKDLFAICVLDSARHHGRSAAAARAATRGVYPMG
jgi:hypothetical protein